MVVVACCGAKGKWIIFKSTSFEIHSSKVFLGGVRVGCVVRAHLWRSFNRCELQAYEMQRHPFKGTTITWVPLLFNPSSRPLSSDQPGWALMSSSRWQGQLVAFMYVCSLMNVPHTRLHIGTGNWCLYLPFHSSLVHNFREIISNILMSLLNYSHFAECIWSVCWKLLKRLWSSCIKSTTP